MARLSTEQKKSNDQVKMGSGNSFTMPSARQDSIAGDEQSVGGEARASKRLQKGTPKANPASRPAEPTPLAATRSDQKTILAGRRRQSSLRDAGALPLSNAIQRSPSKRLAYEGRTFSGQQIPNSSTSRPHARQSSFTAPPKTEKLPGPSSGKSSTSPSSTTFDFLPSVNFDDFHTSLTADGSLIDAFPIPGGDRERLPSLTNGTVPTLARPLPKETVRPMEMSDLLRAGINGNSPRRQNSVTNQTMQQSGAGDVKMSGYTPTAATRARRKSYLVNAGNNANGIRAPRKSVGPGILTTSFDVQPLQPNGSTSRISSESRRSELTNAAPPVRRLNAIDGMRQHKATSFHSPRKTTDQPCTPSESHGDFEFFSSSQSRSPGRPNVQRTTTPSSSKRLSMMPNGMHATGLAARTISPTDARRIKRMSMMPGAPPLPFTPPTPRAESVARATLPPNPSPSMIPRKSVTPSSSRTTPDPIRKSYSSGISTSSTTSYNSLLASNGPNRIPQSLSTSRLPTLKMRGESAVLSDEEAVPPVPAIPKAYESPKGDVEPMFLANRSASFGFDASSLASSSSHGGISNIDPELQKLDTKASLKVMPHDNDQVNERKSTALAANRRMLQPLRLPPLNLLPLSTPTTSKIASLSGGSITNVTGSITPPPKKGSKMVPTTPMTASKANLSKTSHAEEAMAIASQIRSSSSFYAARTEPLTYRAPSSSSTQATTPVERYSTPASRAAMSPFVSSSLPKSSGEFGPLRREVSNPPQPATEIKASRLTGPRAQKSKKSTKDDGSSMDTASPVDNPHQSLGSSLRRRLSLSRKRSNSKAQTSAERDSDMPPNPPKHIDMPPPRLPASATWSGPLFPSPSPSQKQNQVRSSRNVSNSSIVIHHERSRSNTWDTNETPRKSSGQGQDRKQTRAIATTEARRTARSLLDATPSKNTVSLKDFLQETKRTDVTMDRDDMTAEEEMRKLASKRKETDQAAKEVDALQRRATPKERQSPNRALQEDRQKSRRKLNTFEVGEIVDYKDIYFVGKDGISKHEGNLSNEAGNFGYDDERGDYNIICGDHLAYRYEIVDVLGKGSFGQVVRCIDHRTGVLVAIKIIRNKKRFHQQALVEVDILKKLREWDPYNKHSMVNFTQSFYFRGHLCISTELLGMNLYEFIKCHDFRGFSLKLIRRFAKQLLSSLVLLKSRNVIHCDLKPENVLLAHPARSEIKVIDFGSSCLETEKVYTYIQSRFYRSPEVILGMTYGMPIDMWSLGCILAELLTGYPIFPGEDEREQLACIMEVFGPPEKHLIEKSTRKKLFFDSLGKPRITVSSKGKRRRPSSKSLQQALKCEDEAFLDFIARCLRWDPERRLRPDEAMQHEFVVGKSAKAAMSRPRTAPSNTSASPLKRYNSISQTSSTSRPLPEPPAISVKNTSSLRNGVSQNNVSATASPSKSVPAAVHGKRQSNINGIQTLNNGVAGGSIKRAANGSAIQVSALPRVANASRVSSGTMSSGSGRGAGGVDLAAAAAAVSLKSR